MSYSVRSHVEWLLVAGCVIHAREHVDLLCQGERYS